MNWLNGIVAILASENRIAGTGFVVSAKGYIVTCSHVLNSSVVQDGKTVRIRFKATGTEMTAYIEPRWHSPVIEDDLTVLYVVDGLPQEVSVLPLVASRATLDHPFRTWGYPDTNGIAGWNGTGEIKGVTEENNRPRLQFSSKEITRGFSGGPLWHDSLNGVIGVVRLGIDGLSLPENAGLAIPSETLVTLCDELSLQTPTPSPDLHLPLDTVPRPDNLPPHSWLPFDDNPDFVGRTDEMRQLAAWLQTGETAAVVSVNGIGGLGKSQLAIAFAHRYGRFFAGGVYWLSLAEAANVPAEMAKCAAMMNPAWTNLPLEEQVMGVRQAWQESVPRLLIFDNCEDDRLLAAWKPTTGGCRVLVTSRKGSWDGSLAVQALPLQTLPRAQSIKLVRKLAPRVNEAEADTLAKELGDLPLALHLAGKVLKQYERVMTATQYVDQLRDKGLLAQLAFQAGKGGLNPSGHDWNVERTFALGYERLFGPKENAATTQTDPSPRPFASETDTLAHALLLRAAFFSPGEPIPRHLLVLTIPGSEPAAPENRAWEGQLALEDALARLVDLGLLEVAETGQAETTLSSHSSDLASIAYKIHRLLVMFARPVDGADEARQAVEKALNDEANRLNGAGYPAPLLAWQNHLRHITDEAIRDEREVAADLSNALGYHMHAIGTYRAARPYYERALAIREKTLGPDHPNTAESINNWAMLLKDNGDFTVARPYYERALAIRERALGSDHPDTAESVNNLGGLLFGLGDYAAARPYLERALAIREKALGPDHPDTAQSLNNVGSLLDSMGDLAAARPYLERALMIRERTLGSDHPTTATILNNLGFLLQGMGEWTAALKYYERALGIREKALEPDHPVTAGSLNNLGFLFQAMGDYAAARPYLERALAIFEKRLGAEHPHTMIVRGNLQRVKEEIAAGR
jgi:tetratricopeptide (TPR) repeat protein